MRQLCLKAKTERECACYCLSLWSLLGSIIYLEQPLLIHFGKSERVTTVYSLPKGEVMTRFFWPGERFNHQGIAATVNKIVLDK
jgi:hypothetical protein